MAVMDTRTGWDPLADEMELDDRVKALADSSLGCPDHVLVVDLGGWSQTFVTWPVQDIRAMQHYVSDWQTGEINNLPGDVRYLVAGSMTAVVSETQVWLVPGKDGVNTVANILGDAMDQPATGLEAYRELIASSPAGVRMVIPDRDTYWTMSIGEKGESAEVRVNRMDKLCKPLPLCRGLEAIADTVKPRVPDKDPYLAGNFEKGALARIVADCAAYAGDIKTRMGLNMLSRCLEESQGPATVWLSRDYEGDFVNAHLTFVSDPAARKAKASVEKLLDKAGKDAGMELIADGTMLKVKAKVNGALTGLTFTKSILEPLHTGLIQGRMGIEDKDLGRISLALDINRDEVLIRLCGTKVQTCTVEKTIMWMLYGREWMDKFLKNY